MSVPSTHEPIPELSRPAARDPRRPAIVVAVGMVAVIFVGLVKPWGSESPPVAVVSTATPAVARAPSERPAVAPARVSLRPEGYSPEADAVGIQVLTIDGRPLSLGLRARGWATYGGRYASKSTHGPQGAEAVIFWSAYPYAYPYEGIGAGVGGDAGLCEQVLSPSIGPSAVDLAAAVSTVPGTEATGPSEATVGDRVARYVKLTVREDLGCDPGFFWAWPVAWGGDFWTTTVPGDTIRVWIVDVDRTLLFIEGVTHEDAGPLVQEEIEQIVDAIRFETPRADPTQDTSQE